VILIGTWPLETMGAAAMLTSHGTESSAVEQSKDLYPGGKRLWTKLAMNQGKGFVNAKSAKEFAKVRKGCLSLRSFAKTFASSAIKSSFDNPAFAVSMHTRHAVGYGILRRYPANEDEKFPWQRLSLGAKLSR
jgi:hypothetical protein